MSTQTTPTPDPRDRPIVDPDEMRRHDDQFERENPNWEREHGSGRR